tara:strand:- start:1084 stop:1563 length:480 start_codon:yes stop_codon:yes gene_type:complete
MPFADRPARSDDWDEGYNKAIEDIKWVLAQEVDQSAPQIVQDNSTASKMIGKIHKMVRVKPAALKTTPQPAPEVEFGGARIAWDEAIPQGQVHGYNEKDLGARGGGKTEALVGIPDHLWKIQFDTSEFRGTAGKIERSGEKYKKSIKGKISKHDRKNKP